MIGSFAAPPLGNSLAGIHPGLPIIFWGVLALVSLPLSLMIKNRGQEKVISISHEGH